MISQNSIQPMELVISAIHCLKDQRGSSPKEILKYLENKYDVCEEALRTEVESGLKRGVSFGLINQKGGLYCLNEILRSPSNKPETRPIKSHKVKYSKGNIGLRKLKHGKFGRKIGRASHALQNRKKKVQNSKAKRKSKAKKITKGRNLRRQIDLKRQKLRMKKSKSEKTQKPEKTEKPIKEKIPESSLIKNEACNKI